MARPFLADAGRGRRWSWPTLVVADAASVGSEAGRVGKVAASVGSEAGRVGKVAGRVGKVAASFGAVAASVYTDAGSIRHGFPLVARWKAVILMPYEFRTNCSASLETCALG